jgi:hypothetical protein
MSQAFHPPAQKPQVLQPLPQALQTLGQETFLKLPLYKAKTPYTVLYVNTELFQQCFEQETAGEENRSFQHMAEVIQDLFSYTLCPEKGTDKPCTGDPIKEAYVDRQVDPLKLSLNGNLGSGRAYYQYHQFNIKGEKTPFAISELDRYSNGVLELEKAMFETIASNSLYQDTAIQLAPVLAILDIHEPCTVDWKSRTCKRAKIIRVDLPQGSGSALTRISHWFQTKQPVTASQFETLAQRIGEMEGEKFLQRIEHGAWSAGNLSTQAHMIDFDTVCSTRSYAPQFSFTPHFLDNYFGYEYRGQLKILKSMVQDRRLNPDRVKYTDLKKQLLATRTHWIQEQFIHWMGLETCPPEFNKKRNQLVTQFITLSSRCYPTPQELELKYLECLNCSPFHFARFFRFYPILKRSPNWSVMLGLEYMLDEIKAIDSERPPVSQIHLDDPNATLKQKVYQQLEGHFIHTHDELVVLTQACGKFIKQYDALFQALLLYQPNPENIELTAYCKNEDRLRMHMPFSMAGPLDDLMLGDLIMEQSPAKILPHQIHRAITQTILSNQRNITNPNKQYQGHPLSNLHVFQDGLFATRHNGQQFQPLLFLNQDFANSNHAELQFCHDGIYHSVQVEPHETSEGQTEWLLLGAWLDHLCLLNLANKELEEGSSLMCFLKNGNPIALQKFQFSFTESATISNFAPLLNPFTVNPLA